MIIITNWRNITGVSSLPRWRMFLKVDVMTALRITSFLLWYPQLAGY